MNFIKKAIFAVFAVGMFVGSTASAAVTATTLANSGDGGCKFYRIPAIVKAENGNLIAVYDWRGNSNNDLGANGNNDKGRIKLVKRVSTDNGLTWSDQTPMFSDSFFAARDHGDAALGSTSVKRSGHLVCVMATDVYFGDNSNRKSHIYVSHSYDNGSTWVEPAEMKFEGTQPDWTRAFVTSGQLLQTRDGDLMGVVVAKKGNNKSLQVIKSTDEGATWTIVGQTTAGDESKLVELSDGSLLMSIKNSGKHIFRRSTDGGKTWSEYAREIDENGVNSSIIADSNGGYFLSIPNSASARENLAVFYSKEGKNWTSRCVLTGGKAGYSDMVELPDNKIGVLAEIDGDSSNPYTITFYTVDKDDIYPLHGKSDEYDGTMVCNGEGYAKIAQSSAFDVAANGRMTVTCWATLNGRRATDDKKELDFGVIATRAFPAHKKTWIVSQAGYNHYEGFSGFEFIAGHNLTTQTLGCNATYNSQNDKDKTCLGNSYSDALKESAPSHIAAVFDFSNGSVQITTYVNGVLVEEQSGAGGKAMSAPLGVLIGNRFNVNYNETYKVGSGIIKDTWYYETPASDAIFDSNIDDVRFYGRALTAEEVRQDMNSGFPIYTGTDLIAAYDFQDFNDGIFQDVSGKGHHAMAAYKAGSEYAFPEIVRNLPLTQIVDNSKGSLKVERFANGQAVTLPNGETYMASINENFRVSAEAKPGYELIGIFVNGHNIPNNSFIKRDVAMEIEARFRQEGDVKVTLHYTKHDGNIVPDAINSGSVEMINDPYDGNHRYYKAKINGKLWHRYHFTVEMKDADGNPATYYLAAPKEVENPQVDDSRNWFELSAIQTTETATLLAAAQNSLFNPYNSHNYAFENPMITLDYYPGSGMQSFKIEADIATGSEDITIEPVDNDIEPVYYNLQGMRMGSSAEGLTPGIYIVVKGDKTYKVRL